MNTIRIKLADCQPHKKWYENLDNILLLCSFNFNAFFIRFPQRRSLAPSQLANRSINKVNASNVNSVSSLKQFKSPLIDSPQPKRKCRVEEKKENRVIAPTRPIQSMTAYEELVAKLLSKQFKVPIPDYVPDSNANRALGLRRTVIRRALHDPNACNALVLYTPPAQEVKTMSVHDKLLQDKSKILVHVVVDPVVGNILRPHQREGVRFMYDCVTGAKGEFNGCIMADEVGNKNHISLH